MAARSKAWVCGLFACWHCGFESRRGARVSVSCEYCVLSGIGLCVRLITRLEESYRVCMCRCDRVASVMRRSWRSRACYAPTTHTRTRARARTHFLRPFLHFFVPQFVCVAVLYPDINFIDFMKVYFKF